jgi:aryl-alcohol dehydrogenase-like predicted oxidoreductase
MKYKKLGKSDISVSVVAMGCWPIAGGLNWGPQDDKDSIATIRAALDTGVTLFDTAEGYGDGLSERLIGRALEGRREKAVIATKVTSFHLAQDDLLAACERSLKNLKTDYIDLYQIHWPSHEIPLEETVCTLEKLKSEGKIRAIGISNFAGCDLRDFLGVGTCVTNQLPYSLLFRAIEYEVVPLCMENDVGILPYGSLMMGLLTGKFSSADDVPEGRARTRHFSSERPHTRHGEPGFEKETFEAVDRIRAICDEIGQPMADVALAWLIAQPGVTSVLAGARTPEQIEMNAKAADLELSADVISRLTQATDELKEKLGPNTDPWQSESRMR